MSLKSFHIFFILISILLCLFVAAWAARVGSAFLYPAVLAALGLVVYLVWFLKKKKAMAALLAPIFVQMYSHSAQACSVCFGLTDRETAKALSNSILFLIGVTAVVLAGLTWMVMRVIRIANKQSAL